MTNCQNNIFAILIGVPIYDSSEVTSLPYCSNDVVELSIALKSSFDLLDKDIIILGETPNSQIKRKDILHKLNIASNLANNYDTLLCYYSGHGSYKNDSNQGYLFSYDTDNALVEDTSIPIERIIKYFKLSPVRHKLLIIDSCYSGVTFAKGSSNLFTNINNNYSKFLSEGWTIITSCKDSELSYPLKNNSLSVFTHFLIKSLTGEVSPVDNNALDINDIYSYVFDNVVRWSLENNKSQTPKILNDRTGSLFLYSSQKIIIANRGPETMVNNPPPTLIRSINDNAQITLKNQKFNFIFLLPIIPIAILLLIIFKNENIINRNKIILNNLVISNENSFSNTIQNIESTTIENNKNNFIINPFSRANINSTNNLIRYFGVPYKIDRDIFTNRHNPIYIDNIFTYYYQGFTVSIYICTNDSKQITYSYKITSKKYRLKYNLTIGLPLYKFTNKFGLFDTNINEEYYYKNDNNLYTYKVNDEFEIGYFQIHIDNKQFVDSFSAYIFID